MPSITHQWLLLWAARKMQQDGIVLSFFEGPAPHAGLWNDLPRPPMVGAFRPDAIGYKPESDVIAVAEAKTAWDLGTSHSRAQIKAFGNAYSPLLERRCHLYIAVPASAVSQLDRVLLDNGLLSSRTITRLHIPDILLEDSFHAPARNTPRIAPPSSRGNGISA
jgi:hypothetical protein